VITVVRELSAMFEGVRFEFQLERLISDAREKLAQIVAEFETHGLVVNQRVLFGSIGAEIRSAATEAGADLLVMASHRPEMRDYLIGPNAAYVAQNATCSVLVLRRCE
jgi:nucleotide-binding universal stress UspA family protein